MLVEIYGMENCIYCDDAVDLAAENQLPILYRELYKEFQMEEFVTLFPSAKTFPQIVVDGIHVGGYADFQEVMEMASE
tara:strand:- start:10760 stop:10993 length:234 start_codon:yes stop_codon:yes gene_type:complete